MRTVDFETILKQSIQAIGMDINYLTADTFSQLRDFTGQRLRYAWEYDAWPELTRITQFPVVNEGDLHYVVIPDSGTITNAEGTFKVDIGTIMQVTVEDPRIKGKVKDVGFSFDEYEKALYPSTTVFETIKRLILDISGASTVYITYRIPCPELLGDIFKAGTTYYPGQQVYWAYNQNKYFVNSAGMGYGQNTAGLKGNMFKCLDQTISPPSNGINVSEGDDYEKIKIPAFLLHYLVKGVHGDWLKSEMQIDFAAAVDQEAIKLLDFEVGKFINQQAQQPRLKFNLPY